jgi:hypothetical protein
MFLEDGFDLVVDKGLGHVNVQFLERRNANPVFLELLAQFVKIRKIVFQRQSIYIVGPHIEAVKIRIK